MEGVDHDPDLDSWVLDHAILLVEYQWVFVRILRSYLSVAVRQHVHILKTHKSLSMLVLNMKSYIYWTGTEAVDVY